MVNKNVVDERIASEITAGRLLGPVQQHQISAVHAHVGHLNVLVSAILLMLVAIIAGISQSFNNSPPYANLDSAGRNNNYCRPYPICD